MNHRVDLVESEWSNSTQRKPPTPQSRNSKDTCMVEGTISHPVFYHANLRPLGLSYVKQMSAGGGDRMVEG